MLESFIKADKENPIMGRDTTNKLYCRIKKKLFIGEQRMSSIHVH